MIKDLNPDLLVVEGADMPQAHAPYGPVACLAPLSLIPILSYMLFLSLKAE